MWPQDQRHSDLTKLHKIDFEYVKRKYDELCILADMAREVAEDEILLAGTIRTAAEGVIFSSAQKSLGNIPVEELGTIKSGIRVSALKSAGLSTFLDIARATDRDLTSIEGIGEKQVETIRNISNEFQNQFAKVTNIKLTDDNIAENRVIITALANYQSGKNIRDEMIGLSNHADHVIETINDLNPIRNSFFWLFSGMTRKEESIEAESILRSFFGFDHGNYGTGYDIGRLYEEYSRRFIFDEESAMEDFKRRSADYYALLEALVGTGISKPLIYSSIPAKLASEIDELKLNLTGFHGNLRSYQAFGTKYILHQGYTLLGDDMGLGKTVQAIAAMVHLYEEHKKINEDNIYFLVVCPAGVLINWMREISKFSNIPAYLVHGKERDEAFRDWQRQGGICVTNYETMGKIVSGIDNHMSLALMIIDEAHYIKNPDAKRTKYIYALENESKKILLMTGTPLENRVEEMCTLIDFVRPDMSEEVRRLAGLGNAPEFREMLASVYLRRLREDVLDELPEMEHKYEWCKLNDEEEKEYVNAILNSNFNDMRRVSFLGSDINTSSKMARLKEIVEEAREDGRKVLVYSFFRDTIDKVCGALEMDLSGVITGSTPAGERQTIIDRFGEDREKSVLVAQIQAGGTGLNIQAASIVVFCEPQIKPSLENQGLSRAYRMGQVKNVLVYHLLCPDTIDEAILDVLYKKQTEFDTFAHESAMGGASENLIDKAWINDYIMKAQGKYLEG